jgi:hypothetical protein
LNQVCLTISQYNACNQLKKKKARKEHMKDMFTLAGENWTVVAWDMTVWTTSIKRNTADSTNIIVGNIPFPYCDRVDSFDLYLHNLALKALCARSRDDDPIRLSPINSRD